LRAHRAGGGELRRGLGLCGLELGLGEVPVALMNLSAASCCWRANSLAATSCAARAARTCASPAAALCSAARASRRSSNWPAATRSPALTLSATTAALTCAAITVWRDASTMPS
jgi:hypothetical protein